MGIDPFTSMTTGISGLLNIPLGVFQGSINAVLFLVLILLSRSNLKYLNIGAIINMFLLGFFVQFFNNVYCQLFNVSSPDVIPFSLPMKFVVLLVFYLLHLDVLYISHQIWEQDVMMLYLFIWQM